MNGTLLLRIAVAIILLSHSVFGIFNNGINDFGNLYLNQIGFAPFGVFIAWSIKISHVIAAVLLLWNKYIRLAGFVTIFVLLMGIILVHFENGWFVVGGGSNGVEYNFLLICVLLAIIFPNGFKTKRES
ncbi:DoxX family protein [Flavobacterium sp. Fl-77]|uniref:DoxX family protein n=1 Tax=Flavobacterium flavipigmentatum TaxID=2893884 RepID=A0AAJ2S9H4_9FLAO|nr:MULTISPECIES: DoxX family protein [unclassified Flavobacterium]MDX6182823.1 DoxX family protein [Flavobacterium sp. Fl-33]MDX6186276.1 DoxX family protein [Flavobacterium sp. Fl-77]UFH37935.1 DoxX family protein [Flavobacterium sp. F-70]